MQKTQLGVTAPLSTAPPTQKDLENTKLLIDTLVSMHQYESDDEAELREQVLGKLHDLLKNFVYVISKKRNLPEQVASEAGGKIFTFGSYRLGVHQKGADLDTLCVVPKHVTREDFFTDMFEALKSRPEVTEITAVVDAYVPVITMKFSGIPIDLLFARLSVPTVTDDLDLADPNLLKNLDEKCIRSLNGSRVTDEILRLVPCIDSFRTALRCIKLWAKKRAVYSNIMGFFGGVAWAMVVARVAQLYPNASAGTIVAKFFRIMKQWNWPQPVLLKRIQEGPLQVRIWNPQLYPSDKQHKMPIITPAYPSMCATHNVSSSTQAVMTEEFARAAEIADKIMIGTAEWKDLFEQNDFFHKYKNYVYVICSSSNKDTQLKWSGMVESKVRQLVNKLEAIEELEIAHPYIKGFERSFVVNSEEEFHEIAHGKFPDLMGKEGQLIDEDSVAEYEATADDPRRPIFTTTFYIGLKVKSKDKSVSSVATKKMDIGWPSNEFIKLVKLWDKYEEDCMYVYVTPIKGVNLPKDVLGDQPRVLKKKTKSKRTNLASNPDEVINGSKRLKLSSEIGGDDPETPLAISNELIPEEDEQKMGLDDTKTGTKGDEIIPESIVEFESEDIEKEKGIELRKSSPTINIQSSGPVYSGLGSRAAQSKKFGGIKFKRN